MPYRISEPLEAVAPVVQHVEITTARVIGFRFADERDLTNPQQERTEFPRFEVLVSRGFDGPDGYVEATRDTVRLSLQSLGTAMGTPPQGATLGEALKAGIYAALVRDGALPSGAVE